MNCIKPSFRRAFTAVELAVVIAGLSIPAMLLPALGTAKAKANRIKCANNIGSIAKSMHMMSQDIEGSTPWLYGAFVPGEGGDPLARALGAKEVSDVNNVETLWRFYEIRSVIGGPATLCSPSDPAAIAQLRRHPVKLFSEYQGRSDFIVPRQIQSYAIHMGGDVKVSDAIMATTRNFDGDDAQLVRKPTVDIKPKFGRSLRSKNNKNAHLIGADEASHSRVMAGLTGGEGNLVTSDGAVNIMDDDGELHRALHLHTISWEEGDSIALDENLTRPRQ